jgi:hypothetical protein
LPARCTAATKEPRHDGRGQIGGRLRQRTGALAVPAPEILKAGDVVWQDAAGRTKLLLTLDAGDLECLTTFRAQAAERADAGDGGSYRARPVQPCWLEAA